MKTTYENKGNIDPIPVDRYHISEHFIAKYLQNEILGISIKGDFMKWNGVAGNSYVRTRIVIPAKELVAPATSYNTIAERLLQEDGTGNMIREEILNELQPFMYPKNLRNIMNMPEQLEILSRKGVQGRRLEELIKNSRFQFARDETGEYFCIYLRPERIIASILSDPKTNKVEGKMVINNVYGGIDPITGKDMGPIVFDVLVNRSASNISDVGHDISIDSIFSNIIA